jgi:hypothetical protein
MQNHKLQNNYWVIVVLVFGLAAACLWINHINNSGSEGPIYVPHRFYWPLEDQIAKLATNFVRPKIDNIEPCQISTYLAALPLKKRLFVTNNVIPTVNQFLLHFPTQHRPIDAKDIKAVSVNYGVNDSVWSLSRIEADDGNFQFFAITIGGKNHIQSYRDLTDYDISVPGTVNDLKATTTGTTSSVITTAAQAKAFTHELLQKLHFDFQSYLDPPVAVPYTALQNYGLWQVHYTSKKSNLGQAYIDFVIDGTGKSGPFFRWVYQTPETWSLPSSPQQ